MLLHSEGFDVYNDEYDDMPSGGAVRRLGSDSVGGGRWAFSASATAFAYGKKLVLSSNFLSDDAYSDTAALALQVGGYSGSLVVGFRYFYPGGDGGLVSFANALGHQCAALEVLDTGYLAGHGGARVGVSSSSTRFATAATAPLTTGAWHYIEVKAAASVFQVRVDGTLVIDYSSALPTDHADAAWSTGVVDIVLGTGRVSGGTISLAPTLSAWDDVYALDTGGGGERTDFLGDSRVERFVLDTQVANTGYTSLGGASVEARLTSQDGDSTGYTADEDGDNFVGSSDDSLINTPAAIHGVKVAHVSRKALAGDLFVACRLNIGGSDYDGSAQAISSSYEQYRTVYEQNPDASADWLKATVEAANFGFVIEQP